MTPEQIGGYVGKPYRLGGEGPNEYDCRGLLRAVLLEHFGVALPELPVAGAALLWAEHVSAGAWRPVELPCHGDGVIMRGGNDPHVGIYLEAPAPGVLHAFHGAGQVVWTPLERLRLLGFSRLTFVRITPAAVAVAH